MAVEDLVSARLAEIAAVLGCPVETFFAPHDGTLDLCLTQELLALWLTITQPQARQRILDFVRCQAPVRVPASDAAE